MPLVSHVAIACCEYVPGDHGTIKQLALAIQVKRRRKIYVGKF